MAGFCLVSSQVVALEPTKPVTVTPMLTTSVTSSGQPIVLPQTDVQLIVSTYEIQPGATLPVHKHPSARYAYVVSGTLSVANDATGVTAVFKPGDFVVEAIGQWHQGANIGPDTVKLLVIDQIEKGHATVILKD
ncbi:cupin domain-containing protein [Hansschlegelia sp. KR7-227]|uniref:cupin domain-containing protein n=1 Tax=Hansschlegelia sp. KR7-227 TaxID=3400914 RepID=UPI003BFD4B5F